MRVESLARERELVQAARAAGVEMIGLSEYWLDDNAVPVDARAGLVQGFAAVPEGQIVEAIDVLRRAWKLE